MSAAQEIGTPKARVWSPMQDAIFAAVEDPQGGNLVIEALAGTGKSTTVEECVRRTTEGDSVLVCAFNASIAKELKARMPSDVEVSTIHSFGFKALGASSPVRLEVNKFHVADMVQQVLGRDFGSREARSAVAKLVGIAKGQAFTWKRLDPLRTLDGWADAFGIDFPRGWDRMRLCGVALQILRACEEQPGSQIDYDDMIWLPVVRNLKIPTYAYVFVDETQDLNPTQLELVKRAGEGGRIIAVGDRRQAIYGFRGADKNAIPRMIDELRARTLPLSITYRCPKRVVAEANELVPELEAAPSAPEGIVRWASVEELESKAAAGDMVLSRTNAPLVSLAFRWIANGRRATIQGRDIGSGLAAWIKSSNAGTGFGSVVRLMRAIREWRQAEVARLDALERDTQAVEDRAACLEALCKGREDVAEVLQRIETLFADGASGGILLSSTHRAKGLEAPRVWILRDTYCVRPGVEEENLLYVAITRSKGELIYVSEEIGDEDADDYLNRAAQEEEAGYQGFQEEGPR